MARFAWHGGAAAGLALAMSLGSAPAYAAPSAQDTLTPDKPAKTKRRARGKKKPPPVGTLSSGGTDRGTFEIILGAVTLGVAASLGVIGSFAISTGVRRGYECEVDYTTSCDLIRPSTDLAAGGLSFGLMVPLTAAAALLIRKGVRIRRDHARFHAERTAFALGGSRRGAMLSWAFRF